MRAQRYVSGLLKGGTGKTTTSMMLAFAWARQGLRVVVVDADTVSQGSADWAAMILDSGGDCPVRVVPYTRGNLAVYAERAERDHGAERVIIDMGSETPDMFRVACVWADQLIAPVSWKTGELRRVQATIDEAAVAGEQNERLRAAVLLTQVDRPGAGRARDARDALGALDVFPPFVLKTEIPDHGTLYAEAWGRVPDRLGAYQDLAIELDAEGA